MQTTLASWSRLNRVALIGSYLPRRCGIATFTADLSESLARAAPSVDFWAVAMNDRPEGYVYPHRVKFEVNADRRSDYRLAADFINLGNVDVVCLQHEYGIFGDRDGELILELLGKLRVPVIVTLHTVLKDPSSRRRKLVAEIAEITDRLIVMSELAAELLQEVYRIPEDKIAMIPHGIHDVPFVDPNYYKDLFDVEGKKVLLTFGLLSPGKGIEGMIDALPQVVAKHPDAVYIVLGATHPAEKLGQGEDYRHSLQRRAAEHDVRCAPPRPGRRLRGRRPHLARSAARRGGSSPDPGIGRGRLAPYLRAPTAIQRFAHSDIATGELASVPDAGRRRPPAPSRRGRRSRPAPERPHAPAATGALAPNRQ